MRRSLAERKLNAERLPWVTVVPPQPCDGIKWSTVAIADLSRGIQDKSRCKRQGAWQFTALPESHARDGVYCFQHLVHAGLYGDMDEHERTNKWFEENGWVES